MQNTIKICYPKYVLRCTHCYSHCVILLHLYVLYLLRVCTALCSGLEELHSLVEQAETKAFPQIILLEQLRTVVSEADKVAVMAQQLLNGKRQTR